MKKSLISVAIVLGMSSTLCAEIVQSKSKSEKDIQVVSVSQTQNTASFNTRQGSLFKFVEPATKKVKVGESIKVALKLKEKSYIYMIAVSEKNNKAYLILPNKFEGYNLYKPNTHYVVPERSADYKFISDSAGTETIYIVASTHKQSFKQLLNKFGSKEVAGFRTTTASKAQSFMKDIIVVPANRSNKKVEVRKLEVQVYDDKPVPRVDGNNVKVFLSTGKIDYKVKDEVHTLIQSDTNGFVSIFVKNPDDSVHYMTTMKVQTNQSELIRFEAEDPGIHQLIAYFNEKKPKDPKEIVSGAQQGNSKGAKALTLVSESIQSLPINKHTINVHKK